MQDNIILDGWLSSAKKIASPNYSVLANRVVSMLVIHNISLPPGKFGGDYIEHFFTNSLDANKHPYFAEISHLKVSSHLLIDRKGKVVQFVSFNNCAHHAGESEFLGHKNCNEFSIGIELEGTDFESFTGEQYIKLSEITKLLTGEFPKITTDRIVGHSDIAPGRKTDPGPFFDWKRYKDLISQGKLYE